MQQIENLSQHKKTSDLERLLICNNHVVHQVDYRWNQVYDSLMLMHEKLVRFGLTFENEAKRHERDKQS